MVNGRVENPSAQPVRIVPVPLDVMLVARFHGPYSGLDTHWAKKLGTQPCEGAACLPCSHGARPTWKGYACAGFWQASTSLWCPGILEVTESLEEQLRGRTLRGEVWFLTREADRRAGRRVLGEYSETHDECHLPPAFDLMPALLRFYRRTSLVLGVPNRTPARVLQAASPGPAPRQPASAAPAPAAGPTPKERVSMGERFRRGDLRPHANGAASHEGPPAPQ